MPNEENTNLCMTIPKGTNYFADLAKLYQQQEQATYWERGNAVQQKNAEKFEKLVLRMG